MRNMGCITMMPLACLLAGCAAYPVLPKTSDAGECPDSVAQGVHLTASVAQVTVPDGVRAPSGSVKLIAGVGRRILLSAEVSQTLPRIRLLENSLSIYTFGGTLAGWARIVQPVGATARESIQVSGGFLRIAPLLFGSKLETHTQTIDVVVVPGGAPASGLALHPGRMWDDAGRPTAPKELQIALDPILHMTVLETVTATAQLDFTVLRRSRTHDLWECSVQSQFQLVDHDSVLPDLWTLQELEGRGPSHELALYNPRVGAFPIVFRDPARAAGFARWLSETRATRVGEYEIGLVSATSATGFQPAGKENLATLTVRQLGCN